MHRRGASDRAWPSAFYALWIGQTVSSVGSQLSLVAIPLVAVLALHAGPGQMAVLGALETVPFVLLVLPAGVIADNRDRRSLLILCDVGRAVALLLVVAAFGLGAGSLEWLAVGAVVVGGLSALFTVAQQAWVPEIVSPERLIRANQRLELSESGARVVGPGLAGIVVASLGGMIGLAADALSYIVSAAAIRFAGATSVPRTPVDAPEAGMRAVSRGVRFVLGDRVLRGLLFSTAIFNFGTGMMLAQLVLFATENLGLGALGFGAFQAVGNAGFVLGALLVDRLDRRLGTGGVVLLSAGCGAAAMLLVALSATVGGIPVLLVGRLIGAFAAPLFNVTLVTVRQTRSPERLQARVAATFRAIDWGTAPVGSLASGIVGVALGVPAVMVAAGAFGVLSIPFAVSGVRALGTTALEAMTPAGSEPSLEPAPLTTVVEAG